MLNRDGNAFNSQDGQPVLFATTSVKCT